jgi:hypothetical protein
MAETHLFTSYFKDRLRQSDRRGGRCPLLHAIRPLAIAGARDAAAGLRSFANDKSSLDFRSRYRSSSDSVAYRYQSQSIPPFNIFRSPSLV